MPGSTSGRSRHEGGRGSRRVLGKRQGRLAPRRPIPQFSPSSRLQRNANFYDRRQRRCFGARRSFARAAAECAQEGDTWRDSMAGGSSARPSCSRSSAGASASTARRSTCMRCARRAVSRSPWCRRRSRCIPRRRDRRRQRAGALPALRRAGGHQRGGDPALGAAFSAGRSPPRRGSFSPRRWSAAPAGPRWAAVRGERRRSRPGSCARGRPRSARPITARVRRPDLLAAVGRGHRVAGFPPPRRSSAQSHGRRRRCSPRATSRARRSDGPEARRRRAAAHRHFGDLAARAALAGISALAGSQG